MPSCTAATLDGKIPLGGGDMDISMMGFDNFAPSDGQPLSSTVDLTSIYTFSTSRFGPQVGPIFAISIDETTTGTVTRLELQPTAFPATVVVEGTMFETIPQVRRLMGSTGSWYSTAWTYVCGVEDSGAICHGGAGIKVCRASYCFRLIAGDSLSSWAHCLQSPFPSRSGEITTTASTSTGSYYPQRDVSLPGARTPISLSNLHFAFA